MYVCRRKDKVKIDNKIISPSPSFCPHSRSAQNKQLGVIFTGDKLETGPRCIIYSSVQLVGLIKSLIQPSELVAN